MAAPMQDEAFWPRRGARPDLCAVVVRLNLRGREADRFREAVAVRNCIGWLESGRTRQESHGDDGTHEAVELRPELAQFTQMYRRQVLDYAFTSGGQPQLDTTPVGD